MTSDEFHALVKRHLPDAVVEVVGDREELVIYTGWSEQDDKIVEILEG